MTYCRSWNPSTLWS